MITMLVIAVLFLISVAIVMIRICAGAALVALGMLAIIMIFAFQSSMAA